MKRFGLVFSLLIAIIMMFSFVGCGSEEEATTETTEQATEQTAEVITIEYGDTGEYGQVIKLGDKEIYAYYVPAGTYDITNTGEYAGQVSVYKDETTVNEDGVEEQVMGEQKPVLVDVGATKTIIVNDGEYIEIYDNEKFDLTKK